MDEQGNFLVTWSSSNQDSPDSWDVYSQLYASDGTTFGPPTLVNTTAAGSQTNSSATFLSPTRYAVVWSGNGTGDETGVFSSVCDTMNLRPRTISRSIKSLAINPSASTRRSSSRGPMEMPFRFRIPNSIQAYTKSLFPWIRERLTLSSTNGLSFSSGGNDTGSMTFTGLLSDINAALMGMTYMPALNTAGDVTLNMTTNDAGSPAFAGGPQIDSDTVAIHVAMNSSQQGLLGIFYNNINATGTPVYRIDPTVNFDWGNQGQPATGIPGTWWSASWQGEVKADYNETYTFYVTGDDGVRLWVNGNSICDGWTYQSPTTYSATVDMVAGQSYSIRMDYFQGGGGEVAKLEWSDAQVRREKSFPTPISVAPIFSRMERRRRRS